MILALARKNLATFEARALADLDTPQKAIEGVVVPVKKSLQRMNEQLRAIESSLGRAYGALSTQLESLLQTQGALQSETTNLVKALRIPAVGARSMGDLQLKRVVALTGMLEHRGGSRTAPLLP
jgi:DNA recombination protein RmuC